MHQNNLTLRDGLLPFFEPKRAFENILNYPIGERELVLVAAVIACAAAVASGSIYMATTPENSGATQPLAPLVEAIFNFVIIMGGAALIRRVGGAFGGTGERIACMKAMIWWSWFSIVPNLLLVFAVRAGFDAGLYIWWPLNFALFLFFGRFVQIVHGFESFVLTLLGIFATGFIFALGLMIALELFGR